jgi:ribokinase
VSDERPARVVCVGNLTLDDVVHADGTVQLAEVGGNALYAALAARLAGAAAGVVTRRGEDFPAGALEALGLDTAGVTDVAGPTVRTWVIYEHDGSRRFLERTPPNRYAEVAVRPDDVPDAWLAADPPPVVHVCGMRLGAAEAIVARVRERAPAAVLTLDTHEDWVAGHEERLLALADRVTAFAPSRDELAALAGHDDPLRALVELGERIATPLLAAKLGAEGALVYEPRLRRATRIAPADGAVVDETGAGDAWCGGLAASLAAGAAPAAAAQVAAACAAVAIGGHGSLRLARIARDEVAARLAALPAAAPVELPSRAGPAGDARRAISVMGDEIETIPELLRAQLARLGEPLDALATALVRDGVEHVVTTGCGDSWFAGIAARLALERRGGVAAHPLHALELARYRVRRLPARTAVVCISYSGRVGRTIEAATQARRFGHRAIALTGRPDGALAAACDDVVALDVPSLGFSPGTSTYVALVAALVQLAGALGRARGAADRSDDDLAAVATLARATLRTSAPAAERAAPLLEGHGFVAFLGGGPNEASARFGAAKLLEGAQVLGVATNVEEWAHQEYFVSRRGTPVVVVAPAGASHDRALEILRELAFVGAEAIVVSDLPVPEGAHALPLAPGAPEDLSPLLAALPLAQLGFVLARRGGKQSYNFPSVEAEREHYETIHRATIGEPA